MNESALASSFFALSSREAAFTPLEKALSAARGVCALDPKRFVGEDLTTMLREAAVTAWPSLPYSDWRDTCETLHLWTQIVGKVRLSLTPWLNHSWHVTLYVTARGLTTSPMPYGQRPLQIDFDLLDHAIRIQASDGPQRRIQLCAKSVAEFYAEIMAALAELGTCVRINERPNEVQEAIRFSEDKTHCTYEPVYA